MNNKQELKKFIKFSIVGALNTGISFLFFVFFFKYLKIYYLISSILAYLLGLLNSYFFNLRWTFNKNHSHSIFLKFIIVNLIALIIKLLAISLFVEYFLIDELIAEISAIAFSLIINFFLNNFWTFNSSNLNHE